MRRVLLAAAVVSVAAPALADNTDEATITVTGHVVAPLEINVLNGTLTMPDLVIPSSGEPRTSVALTCDATSDANNYVSYANNGNPFADGVASNSAPQPGSANLGIGTANATGTCAELQVTGESDYNFTMTVVNRTDPTAPGVALTNAGCRADSGLFLGAGPFSVPLSGTDLVLRCGATIEAASNAVDYTNGSYTVVVTYD